MDQKSNISTVESRFVLASKFLSCFKTRDWELLASVLSVDVRWMMPGENIISGDAVGRDEVILKAKRIVQCGVQFQLHHIFYGDEDMALSLHAVSLKEHKVFDQRLLLVCVVRDGVIGGLDSFLSDVGVFNEYCG